MGRDLQKRKRRSSRATVTHSQKSRKTLNPRGNSLIAKNWNKKETLSQNYRRLGLVAKIGKSTGGIEAQQQTSAFDDSSEEETAHVQERKRDRDDPLAINNRKFDANATKGAIASVRVQRDASGKIIKVLRRENPLNDPLNEFESEDDANENVDQDQEDNEVAERTSQSSTNKRRKPPTIADELALQANVPIVPHARHQSQQEREWIQRLIDKHGEDNTSAMARDMKLNPMQQTRGDLARRIKSWKAG